MIFDHSQCDYIFKYCCLLRFEEDDDDDSDGEGRDSFIPNVEFEPLPVYELVDPSLNSWVHHIKHILPQGRCQWVNPTTKIDNEEFDEVFLNDWFTILALSIL